MKPYASVLKNNLACTCYTVVSEDAFRQTKKGLM